MSTDTDEVTKTASITQNVLASDRRDIESTSISYRSGPHQHVHPWTQCSFSYDKKGRKSTETLAWSPGASIPDESVSSVTYTTRYQCSGGILSQANIDPTNHSTVERFDIRKALGPIIARTLPLGQTESYQYDRASRVVRYTDTLGRQTTTSYLKRMTGNTQKRTTPLGYITFTTSDAMGV